jgi:FkbM family methyltransferase
MLVLDRLTPHRGLAVDVGANRGYYSYFMSRTFEFVEAFEANPSIVNDLRDYAAPNVRINTIALSSDAGITNLYTPVVNGSRYAGWATFDRLSLTGFENIHVMQVPTATLDSRKLRNVSLIKIDVEGHEVDVLDGARQTILQNRPTLIVEIKKHNREKAASVLDGIGYSAWITEGSSLRQISTDLKSYAGPKELFILRPA